MNFFFVRNSDVDCLYQLVAPGIVPGSLDIDGEPEERMDTGNDDVGEDPDINSDDPNGPELRKTIRTVIKRIIKKFENSRRGVDDLKAAIVGRDENSPCCVVKVPRRNNRPQRGDLLLLSIRIFRYPFITTLRQLRRTPACAHAFARDREKYCVNPMHYITRPGPPIPPVPVELGRVFLDSDQPRINVAKELNIPNVSLTKEQCEADKSSPTTPTSEDDDVIAVRDSPTQQQARPPPSISLSNPGALIDLVPYPTPASWLTLTYYEEDRRIGNPFNSAHSHVLVDGFTLPSSIERFSLGYLPNPVRSAETTWARSKIGRGLRFYILGGDIYMEVLMNHPVYLQSPLVNLRLGYSLATVCRIPPRARIIIYSNDHFFNVLVARAQLDFDAVYSLYQLCSFRVAFTKGWGLRYSRQVISQTPCWMEGAISGPNFWIDNVLQKMGPPPKLCGSVS